MLVIAKDFCKYKVCIHGEEADGVETGITHNFGVDVDHASWVRDECS